MRARPPQMPGVNSIMELMTIESGPICDPESLLTFAQAQLIVRLWNRLWKLAV